MVQVSPGPGGGCPACEVESGPVGLGVRVGVTGGRRVTDRDDKGRKGTSARHAHRRREPRSTTGRPAPGMLLRPQAGNLTPPECRNTDTDRAGNWRTARSAGSGNQHEGFCWLTGEEGERPGGVSPALSSWLP